MKHSCDQIWAWSKFQNCWLNMFLCCFTSGFVFVSEAEKKKQANGGSDYDSFFLSGFDAKFDSLFMLFGIYIQQLNIIGRTCIIYMWFSPLLYKFVCGDGSIGEHDISNIWICHCKWCNWRDQLWDLIAFAQKADWVVFLIKMIMIIMKILNWVLAVTVLSSALTFGSSSIEDLHQAYVKILPLFLSIRCSFLG